MLVSSGEPRTRVFLSNKTSVLLFRSFILQTLTLQVWSGRYWFPSPWTSFLRKFLQLRQVVHRLCWYCCFCWTRIPSQTFSSATKLPAWCYSSELQPSDDQAQTQSWGRKWQSKFIFSYSLAVSDHFELRSYFYYYSRRHSSPSHLWYKRGFRWSIFGILLLQGEPSRPLAVFSR